MTERYVCSALNTADDTTMTITTEWSNDEMIKVMVFAEGKVPLCGETTVECQLCEYTRPDVPRDKAVLDMRNELSGKDSEVRFVLRDAKLSWKRKAWWKGGVEMRPIEDIVALSDTTLQWLTKCTNLISVDAKRQSEIATLEKNRQELITQLQAIEATKKSMEDALYAKFLIVLNEKKRKIRELVEARTKTSCATGSEHSAYDEDTDESVDRPEVETPSLPVSIVPTNVDSKLQLASSPESEQDELVLKFEDTQSMESDDDDLFS